MEGNSNNNIFNESFILDEFEQVKKLPTRVDLKRRYPQSILVIIEKNLWFFLAIILTFIGYVKLHYTQEVDQEFALAVDYGVAQVFDYLMYGLLIFTSVKIIYDVVFHLMYNYTLEMEHLVVTQGIFKRSRASLPIAKVNDVSLTRNFSELLLGLYSINILTASNSEVSGVISGLRKKEALDLQAYIMILVESTLPQINRKALEIMNKKNLSSEHREILTNGSLSNNASVYHYLN